MWAVSAGLALLPPARSRKHKMEVWIRNSGRSAGWRFARFAPWLGVREVPSAFDRLQPRLHVSYRIRQTLPRLSYAAIRFALPGKRAARHAGDRPRLSVEEISGLHPKPYIRIAYPRARAGARLAAEAVTRRVRAVDATTMGGAPRRGIGRTSMAKNLRAVPRSAIRAKFRATDCRTDGHHSALVQTRRIQSRFPQITDVHRMSHARQDEPGNIGRFATRHSELPKMPSWRFDLG